MMDNLARDRTLDITDTRRSTMTITGQHLLDNGYDPAFVAGILANVMGEGNFGQFEGAGTENQLNTQQSYLRYFVDNHSYRNGFSNRHIYTDSNTPATYNSLQEIYDMVVSSGQSNIFGLGAIQRTNRSRFLPLLVAYGEKVGGMDRRIRTRVQVIAAENELLIRELRGEETGGAGTGSHVGGGGVPWGSNLLNVWRTQNPNDLNAEAGARAAGSLICRSFIRPLDPSGDVARERGNSAVTIFNIMRQ
jgi:hypothetical protein